MTDKTNTIFETAKLLDSYMRFRASKEGVGYELTPQFYAQRIRAGISGFFGVTFNEDNGKLLADEQFPDLFKQWSKLS
jgi:hypothetical protein